MFCKDCSYKMEKLQTPSSWEVRYRCNCGLRAKVILGDMGGSDNYLFFKEPFMKEELKKKDSTDKKD